jgi:hypothetical protein
VNDFTQTVQKPRRRWSEYSPLADLVDVQAIGIGS